MESKDDLISRRAALNMLHDESVMHTPYEQYEAAARKHLAEDISKQVESLPGQMTAAEAWEIARKIVGYVSYGGFGSEKLGQIFGVNAPPAILIDFTPEEAKAKIEAWKNRLKVGDVVEFINGNRAVITSVDPDTKMYTTLFQEGDTAAYSADIFHKTGKTIDIQSVLEQLGE